MRALHVVLACFAEEPQLGGAAWTATCRPFCTVGSRQTPGRCQKAAANLNDRDRRPKQRSRRSESSGRSDDDGSGDSPSGTSSEEESDSEGDARDEPVPRGRRAAAAKAKPKAAARGRGRAASYADEVEVILAERTGDNGVQEFHVKWKGEACLDSPMQDLRWFCLHPAPPAHIYIMC